MKRFSARRLPKRAAFTLVEILVVLAIIGILAAILFPAFASVRASARAASCASNLKQIGFATLMYAQDNSGKLPYPINGITYKGPRCGWPDSFFRYTRNAEVFICPDDPDDEENSVYDPACTATPEAPVDKAGSYNFVGRYDSLTRNEPTRVILAVDGRGGDSAPSTSPGHTTILMQKLQGTLGDPRHNDGYNMVFGDGHVKRLSTDKMLDPVLWSNRR